MGGSWSGRKKPPKNGGRIDIEKDAYNTSVLYEQTKTRSTLLCEEVRAFLKSALSRRKYPRHVMLSVAKHLFHRSGDSSSPWQAPQSDMFWTLRKPCHP